MIGKTKTSCGVVGEGVWVVVKPAVADAPPGCVVVQSACDCWRTWHLMLADEVECIDGDAMTWVYDRQRRGCALLSSAVAGVVIGYLEAALWSTTDERYPDDSELRDSDELAGQPFDKWAGLFDCSERLIVHALSECTAFIDEKPREFAAYCRRREFDSSQGTVEEYFGHDYWLTRNGHGCGFWDRGLGKLGDRLSARCRHQEVYLVSEPIDGVSWEDVKAERVVTLG